ncbi:RNA polymerase sigma factor [Mangrovibacterium diazotrophicum]|uniref:RNA polymerase sigma-70 factor (ECF subfamily) n=1 Tax=Mangrovibacterium diazotrophicum TaxID=1261403 RepID=A0A419VZ26_9BACT|nr:RNA polymerase sigma factor [Mangrovibacterium diazotrophicum]RKD88482.1 RNA polymerase sigma-70 factor (ECF subfamily) [Mangrovibacterium diazotrophicum]
MSQPDEYYITKVLEGDVASFSYLVDRYQDMVYGLAFKLLRNEEDAEEMAQDSFVKAYRSLNSYRQQSKFSTWIYRITYNGCITLLRKRKLEVRSMDEQQLTDKDEAQLNAQLIEMDKALVEKLLQEAMEKLPELEQVLITLYYFEEQKMEEISQITGLSESNVKVKIHRARKKMYDLLHQSYEEGIFSSV